MKVIYKYEILLLFTEQSISMPEHSIILSFQSQNGKLFIWVEQSNNKTIKQNTIKRNFSIKGTGQTFEHYRLAYIGTAQLDMFVWHLYEIL